MPLDLNFLVGGEAGQGIQTIGFVLGKTFSRGGLHVFADQDYESRIRGGHNFFRVRIKSSPVKAQSEKLDILVALDKPTIGLHRDEMKVNGLIMADRESLKLDAVDPTIMNVPLERLALEAAGDKIMGNSVALGAVLGLMGFPFETLAATLNWHFAKTPETVRQANAKAARAGYEYVRVHQPGSFQTTIPDGDARGRMFVNGNEAISLGAMAAGCKFVAAYPMTPITSVLEFLADKGLQYGIGVIQPEDEIAAINMVVGAGYAGVRAMTATSGSGFALMVEGLGLAGITETPAVIVLGQRPGPAVGLPTRTEQGELLFAIQAGSGEFPKVVLAPADAEEAFSLTAKAFNLAERFQIPVIVITDTHLANSYTDAAKFDLSSIKIERGEWADPGSIVDYQRYHLTASGISVRLAPGQSQSVVAADSDEHNEFGHLTENVQIRTQQTAKRLKKYELIKKALAPPRFEQMVNAGITLIGWGSAYGAIMEASEILKSRGVANNILHLSEIWPFPAEFVTAALKAAPVSVVIENNFSGQLAYLIRAETGLMVTARINKWDGRPISANYILEALKRGVI
jgi:2-oxoglutarate ferredoxin oxidoreductase subunit alpha